MPESAKRIQVLDLFAGPGGLGEGFARCRVGNKRPFSIAMSVEMEHHAHRTLRLRSFFRQFDGQGRRVPEAFYQVLRGERLPESLSESHPDDWERAEAEALCATLGERGGDQEVDRRIRDLQRDELSGDRPSVLIGGPPCQAYSLVGRARNRGIEGYVAEEDHRHQLYLEYLRIIASTWPAVFVMENVKGILSSKLGQSEIFPRILDDLRAPGVTLGRHKRAKNAQRYRLVPVGISDTSDASLFGEPSSRDFVVRCEEYGVPQRRHRVFIVGLREDLNGQFQQLDVCDEKTVRQCIGRMPELRSGVSKHEDNGNWGKLIRSSVDDSLLEDVTASSNRAVARLMRSTAKTLNRHTLTRGGDFMACDELQITDPELNRWLIDKRLGGFCNHSTRAHMDADLTRYLFSSCYAEALGVSPTLAEFPRALLPAHRNAAKAAKSRSLFTDRFRVQVWDQPSTTITSHISKDGHYFIHPDPAQCRSLTVREAGRLQTFPDNYFFCGPRTSQYVQVGNAVPPLIASKIAASVYKFLTDAGAAP